MQKTTKFSVFTLPCNNSSFTLLENSLIETKEASPKIEDRGNEVQQLLYRSVFQEFSSEKSMAASLSERKSATDPLLKGPSMIYGEFVDLLSIFHMFHEIYHFLPSKEQYNFCDLGSGSGRVVIAAALYPQLSFSHCIGIELLHSLCSISEQALASYQDLQQQQQQQLPNNSVNRILPTIQFYEGSFLDLKIYNWTIQSDIIFANSVCFDEILMNYIVEYIAAYCLADTIIVTMSKQLPEEANCELMFEFREKTSW
jgi:hypothetical protein